MTELMNMRVPGLGLAAMRDTQVVNEREREAYYRDVLAREEAEVCRDQMPPRQGRLIRFRRPAATAAF